MAERQETRHKQTFVVSYAKRKHYPLRVRAEQRKAGRRSEFLLQRRLQDSHLTVRGPVYLCYRTQVAQPRTRGRPRDGLGLYYHFKVNLIGRVAQQALLRLMLCRMGVIQKN